MGLLAQIYMEKGLLVPDEVVIEIVRERLGKDDCKKVFHLDGFPRTVSQVIALDTTLKEMNCQINHVIHIEVTKEELIQRLTGRRICKSCGASYHLVFNPPREQAVCDKWNGQLYQREDDKVGTVITRLDVSMDNSVPLLMYYHTRGILRNIDGQKEIRKVFEDITHLLLHQKTI